MSISDQITRLNNAKAAIKQAISNKGVEVSDEAKLDEYPALIDSIEVGGGSDNFLAMRTLNGTNMSYLFYSYQGYALDLSNFDVSNATDISGMFEVCQRLQTLTGLNTWDTKNVTNMGNMFYNCLSLTSLDLSSFDTSKVTDMQMMFSYCSKLETLDIRNFDMGNVTDVLHTTSYMFGDCVKLHTLRLDNCSNDTINKIITSEEFPTGAIDGIQRKMYVNPENLGDLEAPENWIFVDYKTGEEIEEPKIYQVGYYRDNSEITEATTMVNNTHTDLSYMFSGCIGLTTIHNMNTWDTSNVTNMFRMFQYCYNLTSLDVSNFNTSNVTDMTYMFDNCTNLTSLDLSNWNTSNVASMGYMFRNCNKLTSLDLSNFNTSNVTSTMREMFYNCISLHTLRLDNCNNTTINKIIKSLGFPTNAIEGVTRKIYVKQANVGDLTPPTNWIFEFVD